MDDPGVPDHPLRAQAEADLGQVIDAIVHEAGLPTSWRGVVVVRDVEFSFSGQKHGWCGISLREDVLMVPEWRWVSMIHEGLHTVSGAFSQARLDDLNRRWEEAIVEQMQRVLRARLLERLQLTLDE